MNSPKDYSVLIQEITDMCINQLDLSVKSRNEKPLHDRTHRINAQFERGALMVCYNVLKKIESYGLVDELKIHNVFAKYNTNNQKASEGMLKDEGFNVSN